MTRILIKNLIFMLIVTTTGIAFSVPDETQKVTVKVPTPSTLGGGG